MEFYVLIALITNVIADLMIWREVKTMRISHERIQADTKGLKLAVTSCRESLIEEVEKHGQKTAEALGLVVSYFSEGLEPALELHANRVTKGIRGVIGYYQGKAEKTAETEIEGLNDTLKALGPLAALVKDNAPGKSSTGFHL